MDWLDLLAVQGTLKSLLQYHRSKASILRCSAFFMVQTSHPYMITGKTKVSWLQSPSVVILEPIKIKSVIFFLSVWHEMMGLDAMMFSFKIAFSLSSLTFIMRLFSSSLLSAIRVVSSAYLRLLRFLHQSWFQLVLHPAWHFTWCTLHIS